ncbi:MAG: helix-turn-helix domain-containing protein [Nocardioidaceae bacterium]|nr:helix-turn-helix domain-containing protein [Nocardioidaceae bacterium]
MVLEHTGLQPGTPPVVAVEAGPAVEPDPDSAGPPQRAVVGSQLAGARQRLRLSIDDVADRTRIRPHVIDAIEVDDFSSCGGDVYARGHLRALARVLGVDGDPLVAQFDARYASAPVTARRVFEAELAGPGRSLRPTSGGPRWSVLVFVVLVLVLVWAVARLLVPPAPDGSPDQGEGGSGRSAPGFSQTGAPADAPPDGDTAASRFADMGERPARTPPEG